MAPSASVTASVNVTVTVVVGSTLPAGTVRPGVTDVNTRRGPSLRRRTSWCGRPGRRTCPWRSRPTVRRDRTRRSAGLVSPAHTVALRRSVLLSVPVGSPPHSVPGSKPTCPTTSTTAPPLVVDRTTASLPLYLPGRVGLVRLGRGWRGRPRAVREHVDVAGGDRAAQVDREGGRAPAPLLNICTRVAAGGEVDGCAGAVVDLECLVVARHPRCTRRRTRPSAWRPARGGRCRDEGEGRRRGRRRRPSPRTDGTTKP